MRLVVNNEALEPSGFGTMPFAARLNVEAVETVEVVPCTACFLSLKHMGVLSLLLSGSIGGALSASCYSATAL